MNILPGGDDHVHLISYGPSLYASSDSPSGTMRFHNGKVQVYSSGVWSDLNTALSVTVSARTKEILEWAENQMAKEHRLKELAKSHPSVEHALDRVKQANDDLIVVCALCE